MNNDFLKQVRCSRKGKNVAFRGENNKLKLFSFNSEEKAIAFAFALKHNGKGL